MSQLQQMRDLREAFKAKEQRYKVARWATEDEGEALYQAVGEKDIRQVIEIGTANGWTAAWFALTGVDVYTFDIVDRPKMYEDDLFPFSSVVDWIHFKNVKSPDCVAHFPNRPKGAILYFIDALHTYEATMEDFLGVMAVAKPGDYIMLHDTKTERGTHNAWAEIKKKDLGEVQEYDTRNGMGMLKLKEK